MNSKIISPSTHKTPPTFFENKTPAKNMMNNNSNNNNANTLPPHQTIADLCGGCIYSPEDAENALGVTEWGDVLNHFENTGGKGVSALPEDVQGKLSSRPVQFNEQLDFTYFEKLACGWSIAAQYPEFYGKVTDSFKSQYNPPDTSRVNPSIVGRRRGAVVTSVVLTSDVTAEGPEVYCDFMLHFNLHFNYRNVLSQEVMQKPLTLTITFDDMAVKSIRVAKKACSNSSIQCFSDFLEALVFVGEGVITKSSIMPADLKDELVKRKKHLVGLQPRGAGGVFKKHEMSQVELGREVEALNTQLMRVKEELSAADEVKKHYKQQYVDISKSRDCLRSELTKEIEKNDILTAEVDRLNALLAVRDNECGRLTKRVAEQKDEMEKLTTAHVTEIRQKDELVESLSKRMYFLKG